MEKWFMMNCDSCKLEYDFDNLMSGSCATCDKKHICADCIYIHDCIEGKARQLRIITNPKWITNLVKNGNYLKNS